MASKQDAIRKVFTKEQLMEMPIEDLVKLLGEPRFADAKITGTAVVKRKDGSVKYDDESLKGTYMEDS